MNKETGVKDFLRPKLSKIILTILLSAFLSFTFYTTLYAHGIEKSIIYWLLYWPGLSVGFFLDSLIKNQESINNFFKYILIGGILIAQIVYIYIIFYNGLDN